MTPSFENLSGPVGPLKAEPPDAKEFAGLPGSGRARNGDPGDAAAGGLTWSRW